MPTGRVVVNGIDLAWGDRNPDGLCRLVGTRSGAEVETLALSRGDSALIEVVSLPVSGAAQLLAIDAPLICRNDTGCRPVDAETHRHFGRFRCGCYPVNRTLCPRPLRIAAELEGLGFGCDWVPPSGNQSVMMEVYPHTALVRWFRLSERIRYKKGRVAERRCEFSRLQALIRSFVEEERVLVPGALSEALDAPWNKSREDRLDALICSLIGYFHWKYRGRKSQVLGDRETGFLVTVAAD